MCGRLLHRAGEASRTCTHQRPGHRVRRRLEASHQKGCHLRPCKANPVSCGQQRLTAAAGGACRSPTMCSTSFKAVPPRQLTQLLLGEQLTSRGVLQAGAAAACNPSSANTCCGCRQPCWHKPLAKGLPPVSLPGLHLQGRRCSKRPFAAQLAALWPAHTTQTLMQCTRA